MSKYNYHSLALNDAEEAEFKKTGLGVKKIFMAMVRGLNTPGATTPNTPEQSEVIKVEEE